MAVCGQFSSTVIKRQKMDTFVKRLFSEAQFLKFFRADITQIGMTPVAVVKHFNVTESTMSLLASPVCVKCQARSWPTTPGCHAQGIHDQLFGHPIAQGPAHSLT